MRRNRESGFSLVELLVAMVVTVVISAAVYGLIASGNTAFKRDPELTERQQNVRVAMDLIQRDLAAAGNRMGAFTQVFVRGLNDAVAFGIPSPDGGTTDAVQFVGDAGDCPDVPTSANPIVPGAAANVQFAIDPPACYPDDTLVLLIYGNSGARWGFAHIDHGQEMINFPPGMMPDPGSVPNADSLADCQRSIHDWDCKPADCPGAGGAPSPACSKPQNDPPGNPVTAMAAAVLIRYEVANIPGDTDNEGNAIPGLYRSATAGISGGDYYRAADPAAPAGTWQLVARGVENLQVQYRHVTLDWEDEPRLAVNGDFTTIVRDVRVRLSARTINLEGTTAPAAPNRMRADLTSVSAVRSALFYLAGYPANPWM
jgi:prepilin-type N-terminal cleavage/methylation domain-containing protein